MGEMPSGIGIGNGWIKSKEDHRRVAQIISPLPRSRCDESCRFQRHVRIGCCLIETSEVGEPFRTRVAPVAFNNLHFCTKVSDHRIKEFTPGDGTLLTGGESSDNLEPQHTTSKRPKNEESVVRTVFCSEGARRRLAGHHNEVRIRTGRHVMYQQLLLTHCVAVVSEVEKKWVGERHAPPAVRWRPRRAARAARLLGGFSPSPSS